MIDNKNKKQKTKSTGECCCLTNVIVRVGCRLVQFELTHHELYNKHDMHLLMHV